MGKTTRTRTMSKRTSGWDDSYEEVHPDHGRMTYFRGGERPTFTTCGMFMKTKPMRGYIPKNKFYYTQKEFFGNKVDQMADAGKLPQGRKSRQSAEPPLPDPMDGLVKKKQKKKRPRSSTAVPAEPRNLNGQKMLKYLERPKMDSQGFGIRGVRLYEPDHLMYLTPIPGINAVQKNDLHRQSAYVEKRKDIFFIKSGLIPNFKGYVPGQKFRCGGTFGQLTKNAKEIGVGQTPTWGGLVSLPMGQ